MKIFSGIAAAIMLVNGCSGSGGEQASYRELRSIAGAQAIDCGLVRVKQDAATANNCALAAFRDHHAFLVRYDVQGTDAMVVIGFARRMSGPIFTTEFDPTGWGTQVFPKGQKVLDNNRLLVKPCPMPPNLKVGNRGIVWCSD